MITQQHIEDYQRDGVVLIRGLFTDHVDKLRRGIEYNLRHPGQYAAENLQTGDTGRFFDDYCNWSRIPEFEEVIRSSEAATIAASLMASNSAQLFHEHVLVKEAGTSKATPWHQDSPYYLVDGEQTVSFWVPLDPVTDATLRCVAGSHCWDTPVLPVKWLAEDEFYADNGGYQAIPDPDAEGLSVKEWPMEPGDAVAFHFRTLHGARGNQSDRRRRAFSLRLVGDDARVVHRPGRTSPPFPGHNMQPGDRLREDWFPTLFQR
ncbi:MAG: phytanoyl-CoA dioxygenase family protein [Gammaproteobacteria bacterium]|nr:phytanoyl-CoA dioxygenase family protein [Gammaproteobacteria bacterium]